MNNSEINNKKLIKEFKDLDEKFKNEKLILEKSVFDLKNDLGILKNENQSLQIKLETSNCESSESTIVTEPKLLQTEIEGVNECLRLKVLIKVLEKEHREKLKRFEVLFFFVVFISFVVFDVWFMFVIKNLLNCIEKTFLSVQCCIQENQFFTILIYIAN